MVIVIDNYDSFTYNLVQYLAQLGKEVTTIRNDATGLGEIELLAPEALVLSPGPKTPHEAGICIDVIKCFHKWIPILGVCLGHQAIGAAFGAKIGKAKTLMHGKTSHIYNDQKTIFNGLANPFDAARYHSLVIQRETLPDTLEVSAFTEEGEIMGIRHKHYPVEGVQFHPESILTTCGKRLLRNFLNGIHATTESAAR